MKDDFRAALGQPGSGAAQIRSWTNTRFWLKDAVTESGPQPVGTVYVTPAKERRRAGGSSRDEVLGSVRD